MTDKQSFDEKNICLPRNFYLAREHITKLIKDALDLDNAILKLESTDEEYLQCTFFNYICTRIDISILALGDVKWLIKEEFYGNIKNGK